MMSREDVLKKYDKIKEFLFNSEELNDDKKERLKALFKHLETETEWLTAPCSTRYHCSYEGGLLEHSINVVNTALKLKKSIAPELSDASIVIVALLHDCGKYCHYMQKEPTERQKQYGYPGSIAENDKVVYMEHEDRSLWVISKFYDLTEEEFCAIAQHNEPWLTNTCQFRKNKLMTLLQYADYWSCIYLEDR